MKGQLWEPCPTCGREPVCVDCGLCSRHCDCKRTRADREEVARFQEAHPGFLDRLVRHREQAE